MLPLWAWGESTANFVPTLQLYYVSRYCYLLSCASYANCKMQKKRERRGAHGLSISEALDIDKVFVKIVLILLWAQLLIPLFLLFTVYAIILVISPPWSFSANKNAQREFTDFWLFWFAFWILHFLGLKRRHRAIHYYRLPLFQSLVLLAASMWSNV